MALRLKWENANVAATTVEVYRGDAALDRNNLGTPLATVPTGTNEYIDNTALADRTYFYVLVVKTAYDRIVSKNYEIKVEDRRGAGGNTLAFGTRKLGYYGKLTTGAFVTAASIYAAAKQTAGLPAAPASVGWYKVARNGKVFFVPDVSFGKTTWDDLYKAGLVYGVAGAGPDAGHGALADVDQNTIVNFGGDSYIVRLPKGFSDGEVAWDGTIPNADYNAWPTKYFSEYNDLMVATGSSFATWARLRNFINTPAPFTAINSSAVGAVGLLCQERVGNLVLRRGGQYASAATQRAGIGYVAAEAPSALNHWMPILELVETVALTLGV